MAQLPPSIPYRSDINGLRAWAVIVVLFYHFQILGFTAGFIGVDLFFVISGYLMTIIIVSGLEKNQFSLFRFYLSRLRRIAPALGVLIVFLLLIGWFFLPTTDYQQLGLQAGYSLGFISNIHYWLSAGYFDYASQEKWLLHTWTLGVEFQFYLLYPLFLLGLWKTKPNRKTLVTGVGFVFALSLLLSLWLPSWHATANFYLLPSRTWEFLAGGLVVFLAPLIDSPRKRRFLLYLGNGCWLIALIFIDNQLAWPSAWTLLPVLSASFIILAQSKHYLPLTHPIAQWLGSRSYSLYLWHWPVFVALYFADRHQQPAWIISGVILSLVLAELSFRWVENPTRSGLANRSTMQQVLLFGFAGVGVGVAALGVHHFMFTQRPPVRIENIINQNNHLDPDWQRCFIEATAKGSPGCVYGGDEVGVIMMGDSHAASTITALGEVADRHQQGALFWSMAACPTLDQVKYPTYTTIPPNQCNEFNQWVDDQLQDLPNLPAVLVSRTSDYLLGPNEPDRQNEIDRLTIYFTHEYKSRLQPEFQHEFRQVLIQTACRLAQDRPVYLVRPLPEFKLSVPTTLIKKQLFQKDTSLSPKDVTMPLSEYHARHKLVWDAQDQAAAQCNVKILDPLPYLCDDQVCYGSKNGQPLYFDDDHLNLYGSKLLEPMFESIFTPAL